MGLFKKKKEPPKIKEVKETKEDKAKRVYEELVGKQNK